MTDIARLGFSADTSALVDARATIQSMVPAAEQAEKAADDLGKKVDDLGVKSEKAAGRKKKLVDAASGAATGFAKLDGTAAGLNMGFNLVHGGAQSVATGLGAIGPAAQGAANAQMNLQKAVFQTNAQFDVAYSGAMQITSGLKLVETQAQHTTAAMMNLGATGQGSLSQFSNANPLKPLGDGLDDVSKKVKLTAQDGLNMSRQFADIGVTAAMGMNPLMIAVQQGPQLFDVMQNAAIRSGTGIKAVFMAVGSVIWTALAPILPVILAIAAAAALVTGAFALFSRNVTKGMGDVAESMNLTKEQMKRVEDAGVSTAVTMGDVFQASAELIGEAIMNGPVGDGLRWLGEQWNALLDNITELSAAGIARVIALFVASYRTIRNNWRQLPAAMGAIMLGVVNSLVGGIENMINLSIKGLNKFIQQANKVPGVDIDLINPVVLERAKAIAGSATEEIFEQFTEDMNTTEANVRAGMTRMVNNVRDRARDIRKEKIGDAAGDARAGRSGRSGGKTEAEKFDDIVKGADRDIAALRAKAEGINLTTEAARRLENQQKLLNEAASKGITLNDAQRQKLIDLANTITDLEMQIKSAEAFKKMGEDFNKQTVALEQERAQIGLVGAALEQLIAQQELANAIAAADVTLSDEQVAALRARAEATAKLRAENEKLRFVQDQKDAHLERMTQMQQEMSLIGLHGAELESARLVYEAINDARRRGIELSPEEVAAIKAGTDEYAKMQEVVQKATEAFEFKRATFKGFMSDFTSGLREGKSVMQSFGDAVVNALNKIIDRLLDKAFDTFFNSLIGGKTGKSGSGGIMGAVMTVFNPNAKKFAKGSAFTNNIYDRPTMFSFANGTALGEMGEAGAEAIMPLKRGSDGSLGVQMYGGNNSARISPQPVDVNVHVVRGEMFDAVVSDISRREAADVASSAIEQYDAVMPARVHDIANDDRVR